MRKVQCLFRPPELPFICDVGSRLIGVTSFRAFDALIATLDLPPDGEFPVVDASSEGWAFNIKHYMLSPFTKKKRWTKKEVIAMYNNSSAAKKLGKQYAEKSLSAKRFDRIFNEIVELIQVGSKTDG